MKKEEIISSGLLESYVLGITTEEETVLVKQMCEQYPELNAEIEFIENSLMEYSILDAHTLNKDLKETIASRLAFSTEKQAAAVQPSVPLEQPRIIPIHTPSSGGKAFYRAAMAASVVLLLSCGIYIFSLQQKVSTLHTEVADLETSQNILSGEVAQKDLSFKTLSENFSIVSNPGMKAIPLSGMNSLASKSAMVHWNPDTQELYFNASALPASPGDKQYQLWAIVDGKPVDAGVINLQDGIAFQKMKGISGAKAFAVTIENAGGSAAPTLDTMCLLGNV